jgi:hypothetical protein
MWFVVLLMTCCIYASPYAKLAQVVSADANEQVSGVWVPPLAASYGVAADRVDGSGDGTPGISLSYWRPTSGSIKV